MNRYVLDSTVIMEFAAGLEPTTGRVLSLLEAHAELTICPIQLTEYYSGVPVGKVPAVDEFLHGLPCITITPAIAITAGELRRSARAEARKLATPDALIAAVARSQSATILTNNSRDFRVTGVATETLGAAPVPPADE
jgi:predicted nucleic acid-binding protein